MVKSNGYMTDLLTKHAVEWLRTPRKSPFCLYLGHKAVHGPFQPAIRHSKLYSDVPIPRPKSMNDPMEGKPAWVKLGMEPGHDSMGALEKPENFDEFIRAYNRTLVAVDEGVGKVIDALQDTGVFDNTLVVFTSDNGYFQGEHNRLDKRAMYEESIRIPMVMRYPRLIRPGTVSDAMALNIDIAPTFLELAEVDIPGEVQGRSLVPALRGKTSGFREDFLYEYFHEKGFPRTPTMFGVRTQRWKYVEYPEVNDISELYDVKNDPLELTNLVNDSEHADVLADMRARLVRLMKETGCTLPRREAEL
jgi:N-acetylglucosamine-6-sulfatase